MSNKESKPVLMEIEEDIIKTLQEELEEFSEDIQSLKDVLIKQFDSVRLKFVIPLISEAYKKMMDENLEDLKDDFLSRTKIWNLTRKGKRISKKIFNNINKR